MTAEHLNDVGATCKVSFHGMPAWAAPLQVSSYGRRGADQTLSALGFVLRRRAAGGSWPCTKLLPSPAQSMSFVLLRHKRFTYEDGLFQPRPELPREDMA